MSKAGWRHADLDRLYEGMGFAFREGAKHRVVCHMRYRDLRTTVPRSKSLARGYIQEAVKLCDEAVRRDRELGDP